MNLIIRRKKEITTILLTFLILIILGGLIGFHLLQENFSQISSEVVNEDRNKINFVVPNDTEYIKIKLESDKNTVSDVIIKNPRGEVIQKEKISVRNPIEINTKGFQGEWEIQFESLDSLLLILGYWQVILKNI